MIPDSIQTFSPNLELGGRQARQRPKLLDEVRLTLRTAHYSKSTEESYVSWIKQFIIFNNKTHPEILGAEEIKHFITYLANERHVSSIKQRTWGKESVRLK